MRTLDAVRTSHDTVADDDADLLRDALARLAVHTRLVRDPEGRKRG